MIRFRLGLKSRECIMAMSVPTGIVEQVCECVSVSVCVCACMHVGVGTVIEAAEQVHSEGVIKPGGQAAERLHGLLINLV